MARGARLMKPRSYDRTMITVEARPESVAIDPRRAAVLVVDMQNDFGAPSAGFFETELDDVLRGLGANYLLVTGCTTSVCVESTVRDAMIRDYSCIVLEDCTAEPIGADLPRSNKDASMLVIETRFSWVSNGTAVVDALTRQAQLV